jgi:hypothetical protein
MYFSASKTLRSPSDLTPLRGNEHDCEYEYGGEMHASGEVSEDVCGTNVEDTWETHGWKTPSKLMLMI